MRLLGLGLGLGLGLNFNITLINSNNPQRISEASKLIWRVFEEFEAKDFTEHGIMLFKKFIEPSEILRNIKEDIFIVKGAFYNDILIGVICMKGNHISLLFVEKEFQRQKIGKNLIYSFYEELIQSKYDFLSVNSSMYGEMFYKAIGFTPIAPKQFKDGIIFTPMRLKLQI